MMSGNLDYDDICGQVRVLTDRVAHFLRSEAESFSPDAIESKGLNDLVSYVDKKAEMMLVDGLKKILPKAGFLTEEGTVIDEGKEYTWIIDPLDGTTNFVHGLPVFAISIALLRRDELVLGVVNEVNRKETFHATIDGLAYCNETEISVSQIKELSSSLIATGFPYHNFDKISKYLDLLSYFMENTHGLRRMGSAAVDLCYVACGRFEGFFEYNLNAWDIAAGALIVKRAGGEVVDFSGGNNFLFGREIVAHSNLVGFKEVITKNWY